MAEPRRFDVMVIGGGSGLTAASFAGEDGKSVALIDSKPDALGGTCVNRGCLPTKGMIHAADVLATIRSAEKFGIRLDQSSVKPDFGKIMKDVRERRKRDAEGVRGWVEDAFTPFYQEARFVDEKTVELGDGTRVTADSVFIAAGARPMIPPIDGLDSVDFLTNEGVIEMTEAPRSLIILGAGYIGCEFGHFFSTLGAAVTVVDRSGAIAGEDEDVRGLFTEEFGKRVDLLLHTEVVEVARESGGVRVTIEKEGERRTLEAEVLLVAMGRRPNTGRLDLESTGVELDERGFIKVDEQLRTTHDDVFAYGDVIGRGMFKHTSSKEGEIAYRNSQGGDLKMDYSANPHAVFTSPQIGSVGLTEAACEERGIDYLTSKVEYSGFAKGQIVGSPPGFAKAIVGKADDRILGFHIVGPDAANMIHEVVVAMSSGIDASALLVREAIHVHPTLSELISTTMKGAKA